MANNPNDANRLPVASRKAPLIVISIIIMIVAAANGIGREAWWFWLGMWVGLLAQIALALGLVKESEPRRGGQLICGYDQNGNPIPFPWG